MAGIEYDPTGLYHAGARYYSPILQRFLSEDSVRGKANMYLYAGNNPVTGSDVSGMAGDCPSGNCGITGGQENIPNDPSGLFALFDQILSALGLGGGTNSAPNYQRFLNAVTFGRFNGSVGLSDNVLVLGQSGQNLTLSADEPGGIKWVQSSTIGGDDPDFKLESPQREARIRELEQEVQNLPSGKERTRKLRKLQELRRRPSKQAHGADKIKGGSKLSIIPIIPEAPLAAEGAELPELLELLELGAFAL
jgi:RHS repeat-associated protein